jgi:malonyl-CoA O-methyltransferase
LDLSEAMLHRARQRLASPSGFVCADAETLPLAGASLDLAFSNLALQWCESLDAALGEFYRVLAPGGIVEFSLFGAETLQELRRAWAQVDGYSHVNRFVMREVVETALKVCGFVDIEVRQKTELLTYPGVQDLMRELKGLGARNMTRNRPRHLMGKTAMRRMIEAYEAMMAGNAVMASFEIIHAYARKG